MNVPSGPFKVKALGATRARIDADRLCLLIVLCVAAFLAGQFLVPWQTWGHSITIDYARLLELDHLVRQGYEFPRWAADFYWGYGSPLFNFYAPAGVWLGEVFARAGAGILYSLKLAYVTAVFLAAIGMYLFSRRLWGPEGGAAAAVLYLLSPYLLLDLFVRSSLGELLVMAWIPFALYFLMRAIEGSRASAGLAGVFAALVVLSHNISAMLALPLLALFVLAHAGRAKRGSWAMAPTMLALGVGASAFFWLPALAEKGFVLADRVLTSGDYRYADHFVPILGLFEPRWGLGTSRLGDDLSFQLGIPHWILAAAALVLTVRDRRRWSPAVLWLWGLFAVSLFMTLGASKPVWDVIPPLALVQFPWRWMLFAAFASSALAGSLWTLLRERSVLWRWSALGCVVLAALAAYGPYAKVRFTAMDTTTREPRILERRELAAARTDPTLIPVEEFLTVDTMRRIGMRATILDDFLPIGVLRKPVRLPEASVRVLRGDVEAVALEEGPARRTYLLHSHSGGEIEIATFWFPGWRGSLDGRPVGLLPRSESGCLAVDVPPGEHRLTVEFRDTPVRTGGWVISLASVAAAALLFFQVRRRAGV
jgi:hypothetical protein